MINPGDIISYIEMCTEEGVNLQRGMNYHLRTNVSIILMSLRPNAPYSDKIEQEGKVLIYEGHDTPKTIDNPVPKIANQIMHNPSGSLNQNGLFYHAAERYKSGKQKPELVKVYEKLHRGIWVFNGIFNLLDAWQETSNKRKVFKFKLELTDNQVSNNEIINTDKILEHNRLIPPNIKLEVWKRDKGRCVICGSTDNLHFDHIIPFSKGGSSLSIYNIQLLCARHNILKRENIE